MSKNEKKNIDVVEYVEGLIGIDRFEKLPDKLKIINDETITNEAPNKVLIVGTSCQIKYPKNIPKTNARYFKGVTRETSENL